MVGSGSEESTSMEHIIWTWEKVQMVTVKFSILWHTKLLNFREIKPKLKIKFRKSKF